MKLTLILALLLFASIAIAEDTIESEPEGWIDVAEAPLCCGWVFGEAWMCCLAWLGDQPIQPPREEKIFKPIRGSYRENRESNHV